jgi:hypothetical protein
MLRGDLVCGELDQRRADLLAHPTLNGISHVEIDPADHRRVTVMFLKPVPAAGYGIPANPALARITGGVRITGVQVESAQVVPPDAIRLVTNVPGDHSLYVLTLRHPDLDPPLSQVTVDFMATCPTDVDCLKVETCPPEPPDEPVIDYLAKDYASFRRLLLDFTASRHGSFTDGNSADLALTLLEVLAYEGDRLSWFQDAVATEAYLDTARMRRSVRRHARLVDYRMHDGRNGWTWLAVETADDGVLPAATPVLSRIARPLVPGQPPPAAVVDQALVDPNEPVGFEGNPAFEGVEVFETAHPLACWNQNNELQIHTWGNDDCVLAEGTQDAWLFSVSANGVAFRPRLHDGDFLVLEEVRGTIGRGLPQDADVRRRVVVQIEGEPEQSNDLLYSRTLSPEVDPETGFRQWELQGWQAGNTLPLLHVRWRRADRLPFPLCLSQTTPDGRRLRSIAVGRGNVVLVDHGRTVIERCAPLAPGRVPVELRLTRGPLTQMAQPPASVTLADVDATGRVAMDRRSLAGPPGRMRPAVWVTVTGTSVDLYTPVPDLLDSTPFDHHVVAEPGGPGAAAASATLANAGGGGPALPDVDDGGVAAGSVVRFGDGTYGAHPQRGARPVVYDVTYRVGNGTQGNVGADTLVHFALPQPLAGGLPSVLRVRNPLAVTTGVAAETLDEVRCAAPVAFLADQHRAVTEADYAAAARRLASVQDVVASFRWTGSWLTVFVGIDPTDPADIVDVASGRSRLSAVLEAQVRAHLNTFRQTGYDLELRPPTFVALDLAIQLCVATGHFRSEVEAAVRVAMGAEIGPDGRAGFFHPSRWTFGHPVRLSSIYVAVEAVPGVDSLVVVRFRRLGQPDNGELDQAVMQLGPWEIARCDNDPNFQEHGVLTLSSHGGKG